jgi:hypothetical protein
MDESNIDVKFADGTLTIKGEKRDAKEEKKKGYYLSERRYGSFQRSFGVPDGVDAEKIEANFKNGVLTDGAGPAVRRIHPFPRAQDPRHHDARSIDGH